MCTASWIAGSDRAMLIFNRDERKDRPRAIPPRVFEENGVSRIAPIDPQGQGTWLAVNQFGLCCFLLNNYEVSGSALKTENPISRGLLPLKLTEVKRIHEAEEVLNSMDLTRYRPFYVGLLCIAGIRILSWDGSVLREQDTSDGMLTTSSFKSQEVQSYRRNQYKEINREILAERRSFHVEMNHKNLAFNPFMLRVESKTHNVSTIDLGVSEVVFGYEERISETSKLRSPLEVPLIVV